MTTLASTGTPSLFLHPAEAIHELGMVRQGDVVLAISNSGDTEEIMRHCLSASADASIAMTGNSHSNRTTCEVILNIAVDREACPQSSASYFKHCWF